MRSLMVAFFVTLVVVANAFADPVPAGFDLFTTVRADVDISLPADFFNPGSDPFTGNVMLGGGSGGGVDTIIQRKESASPLLVPGSDTIPIEILQLNLVSIEPITVTYGGGSPEKWNVMMTIDPFNQSLGSMTIDHTSSEGGTFYSNLTILPTINFNPVVTVTPTRSKFFTDSLSSYPCTWTHSPPTGFLMGSNFYPGGLPGSPNQLNHLFYNGSRLDMELALVPIPEPGTLAFLISGLAASGLFFLRRRR